MKCKNKFIKQFDSYLLKKYNIIKEYFFGKLFIKLSSEIILAILIALLSYLGVVLYENTSRFSKENNNYNNVSIGVSETYIDSLFGTPKISFREDNDKSFKNNYYVLEDSILRTVFDSNNTVIAYFITITNKKRTIPLNLSYQNKKVFIGKDTFNSFSDNPNIEINVAASGTAYNYYVESFYKGRPGNFNTYFCAIMSYGVIFNKKSEDLFDKSYAIYINKNSVELSDVNELRKKAIPNTFGVISSGYEDIIEILPYYNDFINIVSSMH